MLMRKATLTSKGQVTIPKDIRKFLKLAPGDEIDFFIGRGGEVTLSPKTQDIRTLKGFLHTPNQKVVSIEEMDEAIKKRIKRKS